MQISCSSVIFVTNATNIAPTFHTPLISPIFGHNDPILLLWSGPPHPTRLVTSLESVEFKQTNLEALTIKTNDLLPHQKLSQYNCNPLRWHDWYGQLKITIDLLSLTEDVKLTQTKTLVIGKQ